jgi:nitrile hydratase
VNGIHDLGGMHGFGSIERETDEPLFHADWESHVFAIDLLVGERFYNLDAFRYGIERMAPAEYLRASYYERWLATVEYNLVQQGVLASDEVDARLRFWHDHPGIEPAPRPDATRPRLMAHDASAQEQPLPPLAPRFAIGDAVRTRNIHPPGHTRLPRYARGKRGVIHIVHGPEVFPDTHAHGRGPNPQVVYNVRFDGRELWGDSSEPRHNVCIDLWESYLEPGEV